MQHHYSRCLAVCIAALSLTLVEPRAHAAPLPALRAPRPCTTPEPAPKTGVGMMAGGGVALAVSVPVLVFGLLKAGGRCLRVDGCESTDQGLTGGGGLVALGMLGLLGGVALLAYGGATHRRWRASRAKQPQLAPRVARSTHGTWTAGLTLRF
jgi:hypothetical protein